MTIFQCIIDKQPIVSDDEDEDEEEQQKPKSSGWSIGSIFAGLTNRVSLSLGFVCCT